MVVAESIDALRHRASQVTRLRVRTRSDDISALQTALSTTAWASNVRAEGTSLIIDAPPDRRAELVTLLEQHGGLRELVEERRSLEEVFRDLIAEPADAIPAPNEQTASATV